MESSRRTFEKVRDDTSSLFLQGDKDSLLSRQSSTVDDADLKDIRFGFDTDLFNSKPYLNAARSWMLQSITSRKKQGSSTTITTTPLQVSENDSVISDTSTLVVANDDEIEMRGSHSVGEPYSKTTPLSSIPEQMSKIKGGKDRTEKKTTFKVPLIYNIPLMPPGSIRLRAAGQYGRRVAPPRNTYQHHE